MTLSFSPKLSLAPCSTPLYFFCAQFRILTPISAKLGVPPLSTTFRITLISKEKFVMGVSNWVSLEPVPTNIEGLLGFY